MSELTIIKTIRVLSNGGYVYVRIEADEIKIEVSANEDENVKIVAMSTEAAIEIARFIETNAY